MIHVEGGARWNASKSKRESVVDWMRNDSRRNINVFVGLCAKTWDACDQSPRITE